MSKISKKIIDLTGKKFGRLYVLEFAGRNKHGHILWRCCCDCGVEVVVSGHALKAGNIRSCGCLRRDVARESKTIHGHRGERLYEIWKRMNKRCTNPNDTHYEYYGGRGISVCEEWASNYDDFHDWAMDHGYTDKLSIDRINNDDGYYPENCRWADRFTQANNRSTSRYITYAGVTRTIAEWSRLFNVHRASLRYRINHGNMRDFENYFANNGYKEKMNGF